jgi:hypothetical protein
MVEAFNQSRQSSQLNPALRMNDPQTRRPQLAPTIAIAASCLGLFSACGIGARNTYVPPPPPPVAPILLSAHNLTFDPIPVGSISSAQTLTLKNTSSQPVVINMIRLSSTDSFSKTTDCGHELTAGQSCTISTTFNPQSEGSLSGRINIFTIGFKDVIVLLQGTGAHPPSPPKETPPS